MLSPRKASFVFLTLLSFLNSLKAEQFPTPPLEENTLTTQVIPQAGDPLSSLSPAQYGAIGWTAASLLWHVNTQLDRRGDPLCDCAFSPALRVQNNQFWMEGTYSCLHQNRIQDLQGFKTRSYGLLGGYDHDFCGCLKLGAVVGYTRTRAHWQDNFGEFRLRTTYLGAYAAYCKDLYKVRASFVSGWQRYLTDRAIIFSGVNELAESPFKCYSTAYRLNAERKFPILSFLEVIPFAGIDYFNIRQKQFRESDAGVYDLSVDSNRFSFLRTEAGAALSVPICLCWGTIVSKAKLSWAVWNPLSKGNITAHFLNTLIPFTVDTADRSISQFSPGFELSVWHNSGLSITGAYEGAFGGPIQDQEISLTLTAKF